MPKVIRLLEYEGDEEFIDYMIHRWSKGDGVHFFFKPTNTLTITTLEQVDYPKKEIVNASI
jgi:hypothetical protein